MTTVPNLMTIGEVADRFSCQSWKIQRLVSRGLLPAPHRVGPYRVFNAKDLPAIKKALEDAGYLPAKT
jgi:DNA-binding transcriptional MerR regulator